MIMTSIPLCFESFDCDQPPFFGLKLYAELLGVCNAELLAVCKTDAKALNPQRTDHLTLYLHISIVD